MFSTSKLSQAEKQQRDHQPLFELTDDELEQVTGAHGCCHHFHHHHHNNNQQQQQQQQQQIVVVFAR